MRILFACGGTAGHINPALAIAGSIRSQHPEAVIAFAGNPNGMEAKLVPAAGYPFLPIEIMGLQRKISWRNIKYNLRSAYCLALSSGRAKRILQEQSPDLVIGTGGYVSGPILRKAAQMGIKTLAHEQNAFPGLTTKLLAKHVDKLLLAVESAKDYLPENCNYILTGNPIRQEIITCSRQGARQRLGVGERVCLLSFGGSLGARRLNEAIADVIAGHYKGGKIHHIHATGAYGTELMPQLLQQRGVTTQDNPHLDIREYIHDMPDCLAAADLIISRAGAITLSELAACGKASILIPSPNVAENHQYHNAMVLQRAGAAIVIEEKQLSGKRLAALVRDLADDTSRLEQLGENAKKVAIPDANQRIYEEIMALLQA